MLVVKALNWIWLFHLRMMSRDLSQKLLVQQPVLLQA